MPPRRLAGGIALVACLLSLTASDGDVPSDEDGCATQALGTSAADGFAACAAPGSAMLQTATSANAIGGGVTERAPARALGAKASTTTIRTLSDEEHEKLGKNLYKAAEKGDLDRARKYKQETSFAQWMHKQWPKVKRIKSILMSAEPETQGENKVTTWPLVWGVVVIVIGAWMIGVCCARRTAK
mmetsp:Transcript_83989/g.270573  ORF Transcript_83989/g.270573 Transcript_83989/m.270573 type:complete len:185 (-) Transcript_83989:53-607(-)